MAYNTENGVKPRFDGEGSEFGNIHRLLPVECGFFDLDRMKATANVPLELTKEDSAFLEYRTIWSDATIRFVALFDLKNHESKHVIDSINCKIGTATWAQLQMCKKLECRFFIVIANHKNPPFKFYEIFDTGNSELIGTLDYSLKSTKEEKKIIVKKFWREINLL